MPNYNQQHPYYAGVDLHARTLFLNICDPAGTTRFEKNLPANPAAFLDAIRRFPEVKNFLSYSRLVLGVHESAGKVKGVGGRKLGNAHLKWAFSEAASLMLRSFAPAKAWMLRQSAKRGAKKAHAILEAKIGRTVYLLWQKQRPFDAKKFLAS